MACSIRCECACEVCVWVIQCEFGCGCACGEFSVGVGLGVGVRNQSTNKPVNQQTKTMKHLCVILLFAALAISCEAQRQSPVLTPAAPVAARAKNVILLIGDGMATGQVSAGYYWTGPEKSIFTQFPVVGFHKSHANNDLITDSAAGATAFACGHKTDNGAIGVLPPKNKPCGTILEEMERDGYATGMVVTCSATHATPAAFIAHQDIRAFTDMIAADYLRTELDCFIGGGEGYFNDRADRRNLEDSLTRQGYVIRRGTNFKRLPLDGSAPFMLFTADREPETASAGRTYLPPATTVACQFLQKRSEKGFFLMVEGSQIDWACHGNDRNWLRAEMLDFDATIRAALNFARSNGETLLIVTGDHECGGLALSRGDSPRTFRPQFAQRLHTASMVPVFAYGPGAASFSGIYDNTAIYAKMRAALK
jgi:alkaline phosphatase